MEVLLVIMGIIFSFAFLFEKASEFIKQLKSGTAKLSRGVKAELSFAPKERKKSEVRESAHQPHSASVNWLL